MVVASTGLTALASAVELYTVWQARRAAADTVAAAGQTRLSAAQAENAATATAAAVAQGRLAGAEGVAAGAAETEAVAQGTLDASLVGGIGGSIAIGGGAVTNMLARGGLALAAPAALTGGTVLAGLGAGIVGYAGATELLKHTDLGGLVTHYVGHDLFRRSDTQPKLTPGGINTGMLSPATLAYIKSQGLTPDEFLARTQGPLHDTTLSVADQQLIDAATKSYVGSLTPFTAPTTAGNAKLRNTIADDRQKLADARNALSGARGGPTTTVDPAAVASAHAAVTAAQAALTKARYTGGPDVATATDRLTAAEDRLAASTPVVRQGWRRMTARRDIEGHLSVGPHAGAETLRPG